MLLFGHIGITLLVVILIALAIKINVDYRIVIAGSLLPDLIDKPIGEYFFESMFYNGRIYAHTLIFIAILAIIGIIIVSKYRYWGVGILTAGAFLHQVEDQMWNGVSTWFWPLLGWSFPIFPIDNYAWYLLGNLLKPEVFIPEMAGILIIAGIVLRFQLYRRENIAAFMRKGSISEAQPSKPQILSKL